MLYPTYKNLDRMVENGQHRSFNGQYMHPNPRFYKYYWRIFTRMTPCEGRAFFKLGTLSTWEAYQRMKLLDEMGEPYAVYNFSLPRRGPDTPFNASKSEYWAPPYDEDGDRPCGVNGHK